MKRMKRLYNITLILLLLLFASAGVSAQIRGVITDSLTHEPLMYITVQYEGKGVGGISNADGEYQVETRKGWNELTFSAIGYITKKVKFAPGTKVLNVALAPADVMLSEVVVKPKKEKYSRKNNPAVEFMKKVIEHKKALKLEENDFYQYQKYEKMKMSINDVTPEKMEKGIYKKFSFFKDQVEVSPKTNKMILPISIKETASRTIYRKSPKSEKTIIEGMNSNGIEEFFNTGDMLGTILTDVFSDVNIYDDDIRLLQRRFVSPIGRGAISFYKFYLMDTLMVDKQECVHLTFVPQNPQDFGFTGHLYVVKDSTYAVKKAVMNLPKKTGVNFVKNLDIVQQFEQLPDSNWVHQGSQHACQERRILGQSAPGAAHQKGKFHGRVHEPHRADTGLQVRHFRCQGAYRELRGDGQQEAPQQVRLRPYQHHDYQQLRERNPFPSQWHDHR